MRTNQQLPRMPVSEVSSTETWNVDHTAYVGRVVTPDFYDYYRHDLTGGRFVREAAIHLAEHMLANKAVKIEKKFEYDIEKYYFTYVVKCGTPKNWRILPA